MSARESLHEGADKKNPGNEGYGSLQGRASASYSPYTTRLAAILAFCSCASSKCALSLIADCQFMYSRFVLGSSNIYYHCHFVRAGQRQLLTVS